MGAKETLMARIPGQYQGFLQFLSPTISFFREYLAAAHARSPAGVDGLKAQLLGLAVDAPLACVHG
jgi:hypothetical protein